MSDFLAPALAKLALVLCLLVSALGYGQQLPSSAVADLRCEYGVDPLGIDAAAPRLGWRMVSDRNGARQSAYQVLVASSPEKLTEAGADRWNSGKVTSPASVHVTYRGKTLRSRDRCYWKVRVWDETGSPTDWSAPARWTMGLLDTTDWHARWISSKYAPVSTLRTSFVSEPQNFDDSDSTAIYLRKEIGLGGGEIERATVSVSGLGYYELSLNGEKVGDHVLDPAFTDYQRTVQYLTYDVTDQLRADSNAIGVILGNGFYNLPTQDLFQMNRANWKTPNKFLFNLYVEYADGSAREIVSDTSWRWGYGEIVYNSLRGGETIDLNQRQPGWNTLDFDDSHWQPVVEVPAPIGKLRAQYIPPLRVTGELIAERIWSPAPDTFVYDFGENLTGWVEVHFEGLERGQTVVLDFNETLNADSTLDVQHSSGHTWGRFQRGVLVSAGGTEEVYEPRFTYHGFRYVQLSGVSIAPAFPALTAKRVHTDLATIGEFSCSDKRLNELHAAVRRTLENSIHGMPGEEATREKMGWTLDGGMETMESYLMNYDAINAYQKYLQDLIDAQEPNGHVPAIVPTNGWSFNVDGKPFTWDDPWWGGTIFYVTDKLYQYTGDTAIVARAYGPMRDYLEYLYTTAEDDIISWSLGDWLDLTHNSNGFGPGLTPVPQTSTAGSYHFSDLLAQYATMLGKPEDAETYATHAARIRDRFNEEFLDTETGWYNPNSQTAQVVPLYYGLVPVAYRDRVHARLLDAIRDNDYHTSVGFLGVKPLLYYLSTHDLPLAYRMVTQEESPGWLHFVSSDRSTMGENLNAEGYGTGHHPFSTNIGFWLYTYLGGINPFLGVAGSGEIILTPGVEADLEWVKTSHDGLRGRIVSDWTKQGDTVTYSVMLPPGVTGRLQLPAGVRDLLVDGVPVEKSDFVEPIDDGYRVASGRYTFTFTL